MPVAPAVAGLEAGGINRQHDGRVGVQVEPPAAGLEMAAHCAQAPEVPDAEREARALRVELPAAADRLVESMVGVGDVHACSTLCS